MGHFTDLDLPVCRGLEHLGDPRVAVPFVAASLVLLVFTPSPVLSGMVFGFCLTLLLAGGLPFPTIVRRLAFPLVVAAVLMLIQSFTYGRVPLFRLSFRAVTLVVYREGLCRGGLLVGRVMAGVMLLIFLTSVMPVHRLLWFAARLGAPRLLLLQCFMVYRFSSLLVSEAARIHEAQAIRLGHSSLRKRVRALQLLSVSMVLRSLERSGNIYEAARMRGAGAIPSPGVFVERERRVEPRTALLLAAAFALFLVTGRVFHVAA